MFSFRFRSRPPAQSPAALCFHCALPLPQPVQDVVRYEGLPRPVCCAACALVAQTIIAAGQGDYYRQKWHLPGSAAAPLAPNAVAQQLRSPAALTIPPGGNG